MIVTRIFSVFLALALMVSAAQAADRLPPLARQALHKAQLSMNDSKFKDAASILQEYIRSSEDPVPVQVWLMLGGIYHRDNDSKRAHDIFLRGLKAYPDNGQLAKNLGVTCYEFGRYVEAARYFEKAYKLISPPQPEMLFHAGSSYYGAEKYKDSARVMYTLVTSVKQPKQDWVRLAIHAHLEAGEYKKTEQLLRRFLADHPGEAPYWELLAKLHMDRKEFDKAAGALEICYRLKDPTRRQLERLASLYMYSDAPLMASATLQRAYAGGADTDKARKMAFLYASAGRPEEAVKLLTRYARSGMAGEKGRILYEARRFDDAEKTLQSAASGSAPPAESVFYLGMCAWEKRDWKAAKANFSKLRGDKTFGRRVKAPLAVIEDIELARREARD